jgi:beta-glucosidase
MGFYKKLVFVNIFLVICNIINAQNIPVYKNAALPVSVRVQDLLSRMTSEEKFWQLFMIPGEIKDLQDLNYKDGLFGFQVSAESSDKGANNQLLKYGINENAIAIVKKINKSQHYFVEQTRLGIPIIAFDETLHGLVRKGATVFPQSIALAATWDTVLMHDVATAIALETKMRGIRQVLSPVINLATDTRWGRTEETYGEDPFLSSAMGVAYIGAFERNNIIATPKHFIANVGDGGRDSYPIHYNERRLYENDFVPFMNVIKKAGARSIMTAYNSVDGVPSSANNWLLNITLKEKWGFNGFVISDASAVGGANVLHNTSNSYDESGKQAITNGLDVIFQTAHEHGKLFMQPFLDGTIPKAKIDAAVARVLTAKFELGLFEEPYVSENLIDSFTIEKHKKISEKAALESIVLLKNENNILPIHSDVKTIAIIGKDATEGRMGGYSGVSNEIVSILTGIKNAAKKKNIEVQFAEGNSRLQHDIQTIPTTYLSTVQDGKIVTGLLGEYYDNIEASGKAIVKRIDDQIDFHWTLFPPSNELIADFYSARWTGNFTAPFTEKRAIGLKGSDGYRLYINNKLVIDRWSKQSFHTDLIDYHFEKGKSYPIRIEFKEPNGNAHIQLIWKTPNQNEQIEAQAIEVAKKSDLVIYTAGIEEGEFRDRSSLALPGNQEKVLKAILSTGKPVVVLLVGGSAITMKDWLHVTKAVIDCWYPGEKGGNAIASILFGEANPSGRLPISFVNTEGQLPLVYNHLPTGRGDDYNDQSGLPLFPFGFGLSYTEFDYSNLKLDKKFMTENDTAIVSFELKNMGGKDGDEVVQLYIRDELASVARPVMELKGFQRVSLKKGETKTIHFTISRELLEMYNLQMNKVVEPGSFRIMIGSSSKDIRLKETLRIQ